MFWYAAALSGPLYGSLSWMSMARLYCSSAEECSPSLLYTLPRLMRQAAVSSDTLTPA